MHIEHDQRMDRSRNSRAGSLRSFTSTPGPVVLVVMAEEMVRILISLACIALCVIGCNNSTLVTNEATPDTNATARDMNAPSDEAHESGPNMNDGTSDFDPTQFIQQSIEGLRTQTAAHSSTWRLGEEESWAADQETGRITFSFADGTLAEADMQIIGTYNTKDGTYLWGWDHPSVQEPLRAHAQLAKEFGEKHQLAQYTERKLECTEDEAWEFTAVAARLANSNGAYRGSAGTALVYMTFGEIQLQKEP